MITVDVIGYDQTCASNSGGISRLYVGDADDFDWTSGTTNAQTSGYSAVTRQTGATHAGGADLYELILMDDTGKVTITQSIENGSSKWAFAVEGQLLKVQQSLVQFAEKLDGANICGQLVWVWEDQNGKFWVAGEKFVDGDAIPKFKVKQNGSVIDYGQNLNSFNGMNLKAAGDYSRPAYEFTGGAAAIAAMQA